MTTTFTMSIPASFDLSSTIRSHGWYELPPFKTDQSESTLSVIITVSKRNYAAIHIRQRQTRLAVRVAAKQRLTKTHSEKIKKTIRSILRIDDPLEEFYLLCRSEQHLRWVPKKRAGRMLRSPTVFEDVVKMMFTTNCSWALTKIQTENLVSKLGDPVLDFGYAFPSPLAIAQKTERWLRREISCGYRAPYLRELCRNIVDNSIDIESLRSTERSSEEIFKFLCSIKGIGPYAAGNILKLLGRYDYLGIDSWVRTRYAQLYTNGRPVSDTAIERHYHRYGKWRGLVCLMEITSDWHDDSGQNGS